MYGVCDTGDGVEVGGWLVVKKRRRDEETVLNLGQMGRKWVFLSEQSRAEQIGDDENVSLARGRAGTAGTRESGSRIADCPSSSL
jgi:hypothetical protein